MRITFILPGFFTSPSGGFKVVYEYANRLQERGHCVSVVHPRNGEQQQGTVQYFKSYLWRYKQQLKYRPLIPWFKIHPDVNLLLVPDLREQFIPEAEVIIATAFNTASPVYSYCVTKGRKFYLIQHYENWLGPEEIVKATWRLPLHKIVISRWLERLADEFGESERTTYIPNGIDFSHFKVTRPILERRIPRVGMLAHPNEIKGTQDGLEALKITKEKLPTLQAVLFGTTKRKDVIPEWPVWMDYSHRPAPDQLLELYNSCQVFLHPSRFEGWGLPAAEAMACGCALVSAANEGVYEFAVDGENALLAPIKQPGILADRLIELLVNNDLRVRLAEAGYRGIQQFSWDRAVDSMEGVLTTLQ